MRVLYYCPEYYYRHGGRTHARGFYGALLNVPGVSGTFLCPKNDIQIAGQSAGESQSKRKKLWFLPSTLRRVIQFFAPRNSLTKALIAEIRSNCIDALVIRTGVVQPSIRKIKRACPRITICLEVNSAYFDEALPNLPVRGLFQRWEATRFDQADAIVVVSSYLKEYLEKHGIASSKILVNQNGVDASAIDIAAVSDTRDRYGIPADAFVVGYIGGMEKFRRLPEVIGYITELRRRGYDDVYCIIVGDGEDMPAVQAVVESQSGALGDAVKLTGWQNYEAVPEFLATFDIAIFPFTNAYCSPLKLFEYLGAGIPTIGPDTPAVREVFEDGVHLRMVKQNGDDFVDAILDLRNNPTLRERISRNGRDLVLSEYTWARNAERVIEHITSVKAAVSGDVNERPEKDNTSFC